MLVLSIGASRNIGYHASLSLLHDGHTVVFLLRHPDALANDLEIKPFVSNGRAKLVKGDALVEGDVQAAWTEATSDGHPVDFVIFTLGATTGTFSLTKGFLISPPNLVTACFLNTLSVAASQDVKPRIVVVTSQGIAKADHATLPLLLRPVYAMLDSPHADKSGVEQVAAYSVGRTWADIDTTGIIVPEGWEERLGDHPGCLKSIAVVRPALLTNGPETTRYRILDTSSYTISRRDVAHFIVRGVIPEWSKFEGRAVTIAY